MCWEGKEGRGREGDEVDMEEREIEVEVGVVGGEVREKGEIYSMVSVKRTSDSNMYVTLHCQIDACKPFNQLVNMNHFTTLYTMPSTPCCRSPWHSRDRREGWQGWGGRQCWPTGTTRCARQDRASWPTRSWGRDLRQVGEDDLSIGGWHRHGV